MCFYQLVILQPVLRLYKDPVIMHLQKALGQIYKVNKVFNRCSEVFVIPYLSNYDLGPQLDIEHYLWQTDLGVIPGGMGIRE